MCLQDDVAVLTMYCLFRVHKRMLTLDARAGQIDFRRGTSQQFSEVLRVHGLHGRPAVGAFPERVDERTVFREETGQCGTVVRFPRCGETLEHRPDLGHGMALLGSNKYGGQPASDCKCATPCSRAAGSLKTSLPAARPCAVPPGANGGGSA